MKLILGSKSPRRKALLQEMGFEFELRTLDTDETYPLELNVKDIAAFIAKKKAAALSSQLGVNEVILCADTIVVINNSILGKPSNKNEAIKMLELLSGKKHNVITGVCLLSTGKTHEFSVSTEVTFGVLSRENIDHYVDTYTPFDKAGAYGIQDWIGHVAVEKIEGSYSNVVGLPTHETYLALKQFMH